MVRTRDIWRKAANFLWRERKLLVQHNESLEHIVRKAGRQSLNKCLDKNILKCRSKKVNNLNLSWHFWVSPRAIFFAPDAVMFSWNCYFLGWTTISDWRLCEIYQQPHSPCVLWCWMTAWVSVLLDWILFSYYTEQVMGAWPPTQFSKDPNPGSTLLGDAEKLHCS